MKRKQKIEELSLFLACKRSEEYIFSLRRVTEEIRRDLSVEVCFCCSGGCTSLPRIIQQGNNRNVGQLFFELSSNAEVSPILGAHLSLSELFVPAQGQNKGGIFPRVCKVCEEKYKDYKEHIQMKTHRQKIASKECNSWILEACKDFRPFKEGPTRKKDKYANKNGKTKKLKYDSRNIKTGKFEKKCIKLS